ncbi:MAG: hypothetical protein LBG48_05335, partial [Rickettsiales bacterium]|nr:hypothetical protein [Rickettsiales bacterium]
GGQPLLPLNQNLEEELINKRRNVLYSIDKQKIRRNALDNEVMMEYVKWAKKKNYNLFYIEKRE